MTRRWSSAMRSRSTSPLSSMRSKTPTMLGLDIWQNSHNWPRVRWLAGPFTGAREALPHIIVNRRRVRAWCAGPAGQWRLPRLPGQAGKASFIRVSPKLRGTLQTLDLLTSKQTYHTHVIKLANADSKPGNQLDPRTETSPMPTSRTPVSRLVCAAIILASCNLYAQEVTLKVLHFLRRIPTTRRRCWSPCAPSSPRISAARLSLNQCSLWGREQWFSCSVDTTSFHSCRKSCATWPLGQ